MHQQQGESDTDQVVNAIHTLDTGPNKLILTQHHREVVYCALLEFDHDWRGDYWWTPFGKIQTLGELRKVRQQILEGRAGPLSHH